MTLPLNPDSTEEVIPVPDFEGNLYATPMTIVTTSIFGPDKSETLLAIRRKDLPTEANVVSFFPNGDKVPELLEVVNIATHGEMTLTSEEFNAMLVSVSPNSNKVGATVVHATVQPRRYLKEHASEAVLFIRNGVDSAAILNMNDPYGKGALFLLRLLMKVDDVIILPEAIEATLTAEGLTKVMKAAYTATELGLEFDTREWLSCAADLNIYKSRTTS